MIDSVPVFINCWNRVTYARAIVDQLRAIPEVAPIVCLDNDSTWPPMREWMQETSFSMRHGDKTTFICLDKNIGNYCAWQSGHGNDKSLVEYFRDANPGMQYYIVTDDDMDLATVPADVLDVLRELLDSNPDFIKVGLALRIDDLPASYPLADHVRRFEAAYWTKPLADHCHAARGIPVYDAPIDTTFAMYRMSDLATHDGEAWRGRRALRVAGDYTCRHRPWYVGPQDFDDEAWYALSNSTTFTQWSINMQHWCNARQLWPWQKNPKTETTQQEEQGR